MFENIPQAYDFTDATTEILTMLLIAFLIGLMLGYLLFNRRHDEEDYVPLIETPKDTVDIYNLKIVEGIGPKIETLLKNAGIKNLNQLAKTQSVYLKNILNEAGPRFQMHEPDTWPQQAELAAQNRLNDLKELQEFLHKGKTHL